MTASTDLWTAFGQMFSMLFIVLAVLVAGFYFLKRFSSAKGLKGEKELIRVLTVHHLSPKEKLVLLDVLDETILVGVTASGISKISEFGKRPELVKDLAQKAPGFASLLSSKMSGRAPETGKKTAPAAGGGNDA